MEQELLVLKYALFRKKWAIASSLSVAFLLYMSLQSIGYQNQDRYYAKYDFYKAQEWEGWRFSVVPLPMDGWKAIRHWHLQLRCGVSGSSLTPCNPQKTDSHSETYQFLWLSWKRQLPMDNRPSLYV